jgi:hypothetical protein
MNKKTILLFLTLLSSLFSTFALTITGEDGTQREYVSLDAPELTLSHPSNSSNVTLSYLINSNQYTIPLVLSPCENIFCTTINVQDYKENTNGSITYPDTFTFTVESETKTITLDVEKPQITVTNTSINATTKKAKIMYSISDNSNILKKADLYLVSGTTKTFLASVLNTSNYEIDITSSQNYTLEFDLEDQAQNTKQTQYSFEVQDIFEPMLLSYLLIENGNSKSLQFTITDDTQLESYTISQGTIDITETISGSSLTKTISLPFQSGEITFSVKDKQNNSATKTISLSGEVSISSFKKYISKQTISFTSNADSCVLTNLNGVSKSTAFTKSSSSFTVDISVDHFKEIPVTFYCDKAGYRKYFTQIIYYDNQAPQEISLHASANDEGEIMLEWNQAQDGQTSVEYSLYRNGDKIYEGSKTSYQDDDVQWPTTYTYVVKVKDLAGNTQESEEVNIQPKKISVSLISSLQKETSTKESTYPVTIYSEKDATVTVTVTNNGKEVFSSTDVFTSDKKQYTLPLEKGANKIEIISKDSFGNENKQVRYITYTPELLLEPQTTTTTPVESIKETSSIQEPQIETIQNTSVLEQTQEESNNYISFFLVLLVILSLLVWFVLTYEDLLRSTYHRKKHEYYKSRKQDMILGSSLQKVKKEREKKLQEKKEKEKRNQKKRPISEYELQKLKDIQERREIKIPLATRLKSKKTARIAKKQTEYSQTLEKIKKETKQEGLFQKLFKKTEEKKDDFIEYITKKKSEPSWDSTLSYRKSHIDELKRKEEERIAKIEQEKKQAEQETLRQQEEERKLQEKIRKEQEDLERAMTPTSGEEYRNKRKSKKLDLDEYLKKKSKKSWFFAERNVEKKLK